MRLGFVESLVSIHTLDDPSGGTDDVLVKGLLGLFDLPVEIVLG